ncbi:hypothetical protein [Desulfosediminicola ganghwensis]|uniref:hypothetical protein n=1 Tax=Desulfosediminicola ganghwensis TaxID=2569540 RepID=UPI0010ACA3FF|nr:hypothetical protein [Desulfosediminicola ganghwensis]
MKTLSTMASCIKQRLFATTLMAVLLTLLLDSAVLGEYLEVDLYPLYTEDYNLFDHEYRGFFDYFEQDHITIPDLPGATFYVKSKNHTGPHVLSSTLEGTESFKIPIDEPGVSKIYMLGTGTYLASSFGHSSLWCEDLNHFSFTLSYSDGAEEEVFPVNTLTGLSQWSDILHGYMYGYSGIAVGHFPASEWGHYHLYEIAVDNQKTITAITMNDKSGGTYDVGDYTILAMTLEVISIPVEVDIKPGSCPNPLNTRQKGILPVAILGTEDFDVTTIDPESVRLVGAAPLHWSMEDVATPYEDIMHGCDTHACTELRYDGFIDLTLKFNAQEVVAAIGEVEDYECLILELSGNLKDEFGGTSFEGEDFVFILKKNKK